MPTRHSPTPEHGVAGSGPEIDRLDAQIGVELSVDHHVPISADVRLAVLADDAAVRADQHRGVVAEIRAVTLENRRDDVQAMLHRLGLHRGDRRSGVRGGEVVAGVVARGGKERGAPVLGEQNDLRTLRDGLVDQPLRGGDVAFDFPELAVHLNQGGLHGAMTPSLGRQAGEGGDNASRCEGKPSAYCWRPERRGKERRNRKSTLGEPGRPDSIASESGRAGRSVRAPWGYWDSESATSASAIIPSPARATGRCSSVGRATDS